MNDLQTLDNYCELSKTSLNFKRDVTREEWQKVFSTLNHIEGCVQFWIGDCLKYRDQRWGMYDDVAEETGLEQRTIREYKHVAEKIESGARAPDLSYSHHRTVIELPPEKQKEVLQKASEERLSVRETRDLVKSIKRKDEELKTPDKFEGKYKIIINKYGTGKGFVLKRDDILKYSIKHIYMCNGEKYAS